MLHLLMSQPGKAFTRTEIIEHVYDDDFDGMSNVVDVFLGRLRKKLRRPDQPTLFRTVRGVGYAFDGEDAA